MFLIFLTKLIGSFFVQENVYAGVMVAKNNSKAFVAKVFKRTNQNDYNCIIN